MNKFRLILIASMFPAVAMAQQGQAPAQHLQEALGAKLIEEINYGVACRGMLLSKEAEIKDMREKLEAAKPEPKK